MTTEKLYDYVFHYNPHTGYWSAIPRDLYADYWNDKDVKGVIRAKTIDALMLAL